MLTRPNGSITWDVENRPVSMTINGVTTNFTYDGDGNRVKQVITGGNTTLYINKYYEKNLTTGNTTSYYYLGGRLVAMKQGSTNVSYIHQDSLSGTSVMSDSTGALISSIVYSPFGLTRSGSVPTDIKFTGQRLDDTGLYYYGARYYDAAIGRFISADTVVPSFRNPQALNRYSYVANNPLRYTDPTGQYWVEDDMGGWYEVPDGPPEPTEPPEPSLPIDSSTETTEYTVVWGYWEKWAYFGAVYYSKIIVNDEEGNYYRVETKGWGVGLGGGLINGVFMPEDTIEVSNKWSVELGVEVTFISWLASASVGIDIPGGPIAHGGENKGAWITWATPDPWLLVSKTTVEPIAKEDIYNSMPKWAINAYKAKGVYLD